MTPFDKKTKLLLHKLGYLRLELETKKLELQEHESEFAKRYKENQEPEVENESITSQDQEDSKIKSVDNLSASCEESASPKTPESTECMNEDVQDVVDNSPGVTDDIKKLWKQIAVKTHPDRTGNDTELTEVYVRSLDAYNRGSYEEIIEIAMQLFIKIENLSSETLQVLEERTKTLEQDLKDISNNALWAWAEATDEKKTVIENILRNHRKKKKRR